MWFNDEMALTLRTCSPLVLALALAPAALQAQAPVGDLFAGEASVRGSVVLAASGTSVLGGSQVSAGQSAAVLKLQRGGELRICPHTSLSVNTSPSGGELMIGFNTGSLELHYTLASVSDTVMTPDFRIQMIGPGTFHLALAVDSSGTTCVRPLEGSGAGVIVSEILGGGSYQVAPDSAVTFAQGKIADAKKGSFAGCGCPAPPGLAPAVSTASPPPVPPPLEQKPPPETHLQMDTPMVYEGGSAAPVYSASRWHRAIERPPTRNTRLRHQTRNPSSRRRLQRLNQRNLRLRRPPPRSTGSFIASVAFSRKLSEAGNSYG